MLLWLLISSDLCSLLLQQDLLLTRCVEAVQSLFALSILLQPSEGSGALNVCRDQQCCIRPQKGRENEAENVFVSLAKMTGWLKG